MPQFSSSVPESGNAVRHHPHWTLIERVAGSEEFRKSVRLQGLLRYLCGKALSQPEAELREQDIGRDVFQRPDNYDTADDSIVRVQVSNLRKRVDDYFAGSGRQEPIGIRIPRGSYLPEFYPRMAAEEGPAQQSPSRTHLNPVLVVLGALCLVLGITVVVLFLRSATIDVPVSKSAAAPRSVVLNTIFPNGRRIHLVLADSTFGLFQHFSERPVSLSAYLNREYEHWVTELPIQHPMREVYRNILGRRYTSMADAMFVGRMHQLSGSEQNRVTVWSARDFQTRALRGENAVLLGARRSNPWVELFEDKLNWRLRVEVPDADIFRNTSPLPGEPLECRGDGKSPWPSGFCQVALLPNSDGTGRVVLIGGTEMTASEAGVNLIFTEEGLAVLGRRLGLAPGAQLPCFEALLSTKRAGDAPADFVIISHRLLEPKRAAAH